MNFSDRTKEIGDEICGLLWVCATLPKLMSGELEVAQ